MSSSSEIPINNVWDKVVKVLMTLLSAAWIWLFATVNSMQVTVGRMEDRIINQRSDFDAQRNIESTFQSAMGSRLDALQVRLESSMDRLDTKLTAAIQKVQDQNRDSLAEITKTLQDVRMAVGANRKELSR